MKLLFIGYLHGYGGAEKQLIMLSNQMAQRGHDVNLLSFCANNPCCFIENNVNYFFKKDKYRFKLLNFINRYNYLNRMIKKINPDLIINFNVQPAFICTILGKEIAFRSIYAERGDPYDDEYSGINGKIRDFMVKHIGGIVFQTKGAQNFFSDKIRSKSIIINNPIFIDKKNSNITFRKIEKKIVTVGRLHKQKNQELFLKAIEKLPEEYKDYIVEIYGEGELRAKLLEQINRMDSSIEVRLMGAHKNVLERIKNAELFVLTSDYEGIPNALMEAMALGIPCISTDCRPGGARELIDNGKNGYIVPCGDVKSLTETMINLLKNRELAFEMAQLGKEKVLKLRPEIIYNRWEEYFKEKLKNVN